MSCESIAVGPVSGIVLAAGAGQRMGRPKALVTGQRGRPWVVDVLRAVGCHDVRVAGGASVDLVRR